jgi:hypothetical protein
MPETSFLFYSLIAVLAIRKIFGSGGWKQNELENKEKWYSQQKARSLFILVMETEIRNMRRGRAGESY